MRKFKELLRKKLRTWLGIENLEQTNKELHFAMKDIVGIGIDVKGYHKDADEIIIFSGVNGGVLRHISVRFGNLQELEGFVRELKARFRTSRTYLDVPHELDRWKP